MSVSRRMIVLVDGFCDAHTAKTAVCVIRYCAEQVVAVLDRAAAGGTSEELLGVGGTTPVVASIADAPPADTLLIGIAPPGGKLPEHWRPIVLEAIRKRMTVLSGMHEFLRDDVEFAQAAVEHGGKLVDLRDAGHSEVAGCEPMREECLRIHTVANDCSCGKMVASVELTEGLKRDGIDARFVATGQTGMIIADGGMAVDHLIADFLSGAAEKLVLDNQQHEVIVVEGQGSLVHPRYSGVTLGLLHGLRPHGLVMCYEMGREAFFGLEQIELPPLGEVVEFYERAAAFVHPCSVIGIAVNGRAFSDAEVSAECARVEEQLGLPACDVIRHGPSKLVAAVRALKDSLG